MDDIEIKIFNILPPNLKKQTDTLRHKAFHKENFTKEQEAANEEKYVFEKGAFKFVIAFLGDIPVGYIRLFKRIIHIDGKELLLGGVGGVCVSPDYQRKGIATKTLKGAMEELRKEKCAIAYLCTNVSKLKNLYGQVGFVPLNREYTYIGTSGKRYFEKDGMIAPISSEEIFKQVINGNTPFNLEGMNW